MSELPAENWARVEEIFHAASGLTGLARKAYLTEACGSDGALRSDVESLLASDRVVANSMADLVRKEARGLLGIHQEPEAGTRIGPYRIVRLLGEGGMGAVYLAERDDAEYQRQVAIKLLRPEHVIRAELLRRFRAERQILANLDHPNIARMLDGGVTDWGTPYLVMEYVEGAPIDRYCREQRLTLAARLDLFRKVCAAVQCAHANLVIHRDLKPSNILVTKDGTAKLLDFGIAKMLTQDNNSTQDGGLTQAAERVMTPEYASPEQVRGEAITTATDIYALGALLFELLTDSRLYDFRSTDPVRQQVIVCEQAPSRPSTVVGTESAVNVRELRGDLDNIVLKALRKEPGLRYASAEQLAEDVQRYQEGFAVLASRGTRRYEWSKFIRRNRVAVGAAGLVTLLIAGFAVGMGILAARVAEERDRAEAVSRFLAGMFESANPFQALGRNLSARELLDVGAERVRKDLRGEPAVRLQLMETISQAYFRLGVFDRAEALYQDQLAILRAQHGEDSLPVASGLRRLADMERSRSRLDSAEKHLRQALAIQLRHASQNDSEVPHTYNNLGLVLHRTGQVREAEALLRAAIDGAKRALPATEVLVMESNLGALLIDCGHYREAEAVLRHVLAERRRLLPAKHPQIARSLARLGRLLKMQNQLDEAEKVVTEAMVLSKEVLPKEHVELLVTANLLGMIRLERGDLAGAEDLIRPTVEIGLRTLGDHAEVANFENNLAAIEAQKGHASAARDWFRQSLATATRLNNGSGPQMAQMLSRYGEFLVTQGEWAEADLVLTDAVARQRALVREVTPELAKNEKLQRLAAQQRQKSGGDGSPPHN